MLQSCHRGVLIQRIILLALLTLTAGILPRTEAIDPWSSYKQALGQRPLLTKAITAATLLSVSDVACQKFEGRGKTRKPLDRKRTLQVSATGFAWSGPIAHTWYGLLERIVPPMKSQALGVMIRLCLETLLFSPVAVFGYLTFRSILEGVSAADKLRQKWKKALFASWRFWPAVSVFNYALVPLPFRVLYVNCLSLLWNGYLTNLNSSLTTGATTTGKNYDTKQ